LALAGARKHEIFAALFLDAQNHLIEYRDRSTAPWTQDQVFPREVVKEALRFTLPPSSWRITIRPARPSPAGPMNAHPHIARLRSRWSTSRCSTTSSLAGPPGRTVSFAERGLL